VWSKGVSTRSLMIPGGHPESDTERFIMRSSKAVVLLTVFALGRLLFAATNQLGVADPHIMSFDTPMRVGTALLPKGFYRITHTMEGENQITVFKQMYVKDHPAEARVKCTLVPLREKADHTETFFGQDNANQSVLVALTFSGDTAKHMFSNPE
jgi:hypothetical protein